MRIMIVLLGLFIAYADGACQKACVLYVPGSDLTTSTFSLCKQQCESTANCLFFTWNTNTQGCGLRNYEFTSIFTAPTQNTGFPFSSAMLQNLVPVGKVTSETSTTACENLCLNDPTCTTWSFFNSADSQNPNTCVLNNYDPQVEIPGPATVVSGKKSCNCVENNVLYVESSVEKASLEDCRSTCQATPSCSFFTWNEMAQACGLRDYPVEGAVFASGQQTGFPYSNNVLDDTVLVQGVVGANSVVECRSICLNDPECITWSWINENPANPFPNICIINKYEPERAIQIPGPTFIISGRKNCSSPIASQNEVALVIGGQKSSGGYTNTIEQYGSCNISVNSFPSSTGLAKGATFEGNVYVCGGVTNPPGVCKILGNTGSWSDGPSLNQFIYYFTLTTVGNQLVVLGGYSSGILTTIKTLASGATQWDTKSFGLNPGRYHHCAAALSSSEVAIVGGFGNGFGFLSLVQRININTGSTANMTNLPQRRAYHVCEVIGSTLFVAGGYASNQYTDTVLSLDVSSNTNTWSTLASMSTTRYFAESAVLNGEFAVFGGRNSSYLVTQSYETFDGSWTAFSMNGNGKIYHAVAVLPCP